MQELLCAEEDEENEEEPRPDMGLGGADSDEGEIRPAMVRSHTPSAQRRQHAQRTFPASISKQLAAALPPHHGKSTQPPQTAQEIRDGFAQHVRGGGGFFESGSAVVALPPRISDTRGRYLGIEAIGAGQLDVQAKIRTSLLREAHGERDGWEDESWDEESGLQRSAGLDGPAQAKDNDSHAPEACPGFVQGSKGRKQADLDCVGWVTQVCFWNNSNEPRWHNAVVIASEHEQFSQEGAQSSSMPATVQKERVQVFYEADGVEEWISVEDPTLAWRKNNLAAHKKSKEEVARCLHAIRDYD